MGNPSPTSYAPALNYTAYQAAAAGASAPGQALDGDFAAIAASINSLILALQDVRRADGALNNRVVTLDSLSAAVSGLIGPWNVRGNWASGTPYAPNDIVRAPNTFGTYACAVSNVGGDFPADLAAGYWMVICPRDNSALANIQPATAGNAGSVLTAIGADSYAWTPPASVAPPIVEFAAFTLAAADTGKTVLWTGNAGAGTGTLPPIASLVAGNSYTIFNAGTSNLTMQGDATINGVASFTVAPTNSATFVMIGTAWIAIPSAEKNVGDLVYGAWLNPPPRHLLCYGQAVSRTTYAALFSAIGVAFGPGNGATTFNLPDARCLSLIGTDGMGPTPSARITVANAGFDPTVLGAIGGSQLVQTHTHGITDPGHTHAITDPGHAHGLRHDITGGPDATTPVYQTGVTNSYPLVTLSAQTGISLATTPTGLAIANFGSGGSGNIPPSLVCNVAIYAGV